MISTLWLLNGFEKNFYDFIFGKNTTHSRREYIASADSRCINVEAELPKKEEIHFIRKVWNAVEWSTWIYISITIPTPSAERASVTTVTNKNYEAKSFDETFTISPIQSETRHTRRCQRCMQFAFFDTTFTTICPFCDDSTSPDSTPP